MSDDKKLQAIDLAREVVAFLGERTSEEDVAQNACRIAADVFSNEISRKMVAASIHSSLFGKR